MHPHSTTDLLGTECRICIKCGKSLPLTAYRRQNKTCTHCRDVSLRDYYKNKRTRNAATTARRRGITSDEYSRLFEESGDRCTICGQQETHQRTNGTTYSLAVDHDHITGRVRGLLCFRCNMLVGAVENLHGELGVIASVIDYLRANYALP